MWKVFVGVVIGCALTDYVKKNYVIEKSCKDGEFSFKMTSKA